MKNKDFSAGFTVLMAVYDGDDFDLFKKAIKSVLDNKLKPSQIVLVVDGPLQEKKNDFIKSLSIQINFLDVLFLKKNGGLANALNQGLRLTKFPWVVRADADDINMPNRFLVLANAIRKDSDIDLIGSYTLEIDKNGDKIAVKSVPLQHIDILRWLPYRNPFNHMSVAFRLKKVLDLKGYPDIFQKEDYALWILMLFNGAKACNIADILIHATAGKEMYRRRGGLKSVRAEIHLQKILIKCQFQNFLGALFAGTARGLILLLPCAIRAVIYKRLLRRVC
jgi:glycosyltransferase involved in cell wall biosynthesis